MLKKFKQFISLFILLNLLIIVSSFCFSLIFPVAPMARAAELKTFENAGCSEHAPTQAMPPDFAYGRANGGSDVMPCCVGEKDANLLNAPTTDHKNQPEQSFTARTNQATAPVKSRLNFPIAYSAPPPEHKIISSIILLI